MMTLKKKFKKIHSYSVTNKTNNHKKYLHKWLQAYSHQVTK